MYTQKRLLNNMFLKLFKNSQYFNSSKVNDSPHIPILLKEAIHYLNVGPNKKFIDMTFGAGGHTRAILQNAPDVKVYALDRDPVAYEYATHLSSEYPGQIIPILGKFSDLPKIFQSAGVKQRSFDGILFDFGCSSMQLDEPYRGFSYLKNGLLDMRMSMNNDQIKALDVLSKIDENNLAKILRIYGEESAAKKIAKAIVESRSRFSQIENTKQLADLVSSCISQAFSSDTLQHSTHLATKTFQAIRIFINNELNEINYSMLLAQRYLKKRGRLVAITFHSLEDTIVKRHIKGNIIEGLANPVPLKYSAHDLLYDKHTIGSLSRRTWKQLHRNVIVCTQNEILQNSRSRSAKLRAAEKVQ